MDTPPESSEELEDKAPNCLGCAHSYITWDRRFPYGCRAMNFKSKRRPHVDVLESSGEPCKLFLLRRREP